MYILKIILLFMGLYPTIASAGYQSADNEYINDFLHIIDVVIK